MQEQPPLFLEFMQALTPHFHWIAERERCGLWMVAKRVDLWLNRVFDTAEDFRLQGALPALLGALRKLHPDAWEACLHINTSPIPRFIVPAAHWWLSGNVKLGLIWGSVVHCDVFVLVCCAFCMLGNVHLMFLEVLDTHLVKVQGGGYFFWRRLS